MKSPLSLKMRAIALLAQREHSPTELRRKLVRIRRDMETAAALAAAEGKASEAGSAPEEIRGERFRADRRLDAIAGDIDIDAEVDTLMDWLRANGYLSEARFIESRVNARASRYGTLRIKQELAQHGLALKVEHQSELMATEFERAKAIWQRRYGGQCAPISAAEPAQRARQIRFLTARGFAPDVVRRVLRSAGED